jgi:hypothetical protein
MQGNRKGAYAPLDWAQINYQAQSEEKSSDGCNVTPLIGQGLMRVGWGSPDFVDSDQGLTWVSVGAAMNRCS